MSSRQGTQQSTWTLANAHAAAAKRKLDELTGGDCLLDDDYEYLCNRMRTEQFTASDVSRFQVSDHHPSRHRRRSRSSSSADASSSSSSPAADDDQKAVPFPSLQFFVRTINGSGGGGFGGSKTLVVHADPSDTVGAIHERIQLRTGIPVREQGLVYRGRQLDWDKSIAECNIPRDATLELVSRLRSTGHPTAWRCIDNMITRIFSVYKGGASSSQAVKDSLMEFLNNIPNKPPESNEAQPPLRIPFPQLKVGLDQNPLPYIEVFIASSAPAALVMLYKSPIKRNKDCAEECIRYFIQIVKEKSFYQMFAPVVLEFCKLLNYGNGNDNARGNGNSEDPLYDVCRSCLGTMVESSGIGNEESKMLPKLSSVPEVTVQDIFPFVTELAGKLSRVLAEASTSKLTLGPSDGDVRDFVAFLHPYRKAIIDQVVSWVAVPFPGDVCLRNSTGPGTSRIVPCYVDGIKFLNTTLFDLLGKMDMCLKKMEEHLDSNTVDKRKAGSEHHSPPVKLAWCQYLTILRELDGLSKMFKGAEEIFWLRMSERKAALCNLVIRFAKRDSDNMWISRHKEVINFEARRHLAMLLLPEMKDEYEELHEMLIDRSHLLAESFEYIANANPLSLRGGLFMEFKNEEATGPGVLREWFFLVCREIFNPQNALFVACPNDHRKFFPNSASKVNSMHSDYYKFAGRVIALALMHKLQVGIVFDRVFTLQLAGEAISLEDVQDADPYLYSSCKQILEMDSAIIDHDVLGLTFIREVEELGSRKIVELCHDGQNIAVNSKNRKKYVKLLIEHRFVTSIAEQVAKFAEGFSDVCDNTRTSFFKSLAPEDLNWMLRGSESAISVEDWKAHTEYNGYKQTDPQILWFWKIVGKMSAEQKKVLLFFWTSIKYLPFEGFSGLASKLYIYKTPESNDRLPSSHTCFFRLCFPPYPSMSAMRDRLNIITQEHVGCSFGTW
ncbi:OLC1v1020804C2 [Oldenlandia corymbosa var. corymbosa]|uniref:HECT-type E3 ubiquitin transferase n=1 Tax=Oldenlandia corymbosa var. corymbosa TaxID=529605 RepID=A0AAV1BU99_OLDCO|nr:OLC1v1020804C2 [Oldenlandia corymbosa var. corymbosa]